MEVNTLNSIPKVAPELYFLIAKFLSGGPLQETAKVLKNELEKYEILPTRLDWLGNVHEQSIQDLELQYPNVSSQHLVEVCALLLRKKGARDPTRSLLCPSLAGRPSIKPIHKAKNVLCRIQNRSTGLCMGPLARPTHTLVPAALFANLQLQRRTLGHLSAVYCVLYDRTGLYIITGADDLLVKVWSAVDGRLLGTFRGASAEITDMAVSPDNRLLGAGSLDRLIRVWDLQTAAPVAVLQGHSGMITSLHFCPAKSGDLSCLVSTSTDGSVAFWTYSQPGSAKPSFISKPVQYVERMRPGTCHMICCAWSPGGAFLAAGSADHHVRVYMMAESGPKRILEMPAHDDAVDSLQWAHCGLRFVSGSKDGTAIVWQLHATQWRQTRLYTDDSSLGEVATTDDGRKLRVTMVAWDCTDSFIITAVNDYTLKVWCANTYKLLKVLKGHTDEVYVLETNPIHANVLLSAGHDGQILVWDIGAGCILNSFLNKIDGQGHGAVFDAKWSPCGAAVAATDSHGHILMLGMGQGHPRLKTLPIELFFHTDYRPLVRDAMGGVCDEQTGAPPHLMPPPFLVDVEGSPHPPPCQRLVPGRENAAPNQLVPDTGMEISYDNRPRSDIDVMIEALALRQLVQQLDNEEQPQMENDLGAGGGRAFNFRNEGVRNTAAGSWQRGAPLSVCRRAMVAPLQHAIARAVEKRADEMSQLEISWYRREMRRRPLMISTATSSSAARRGGRTRGGRKGVTRSGIVRSGAAVPGSQSSRSGLAQASEQNEEGVDGEETEEEAHTGASANSSDSDSSVRLSAARSSPHSSATTDDKTDNSRMPRELRLSIERLIRFTDMPGPPPPEKIYYSRSSSGSSSEYSDWVADRPGASLAPPKRSKRKPVARRRYSPNPTASKRSSAGVAPSTSGTRPAGGHSPEQAGPSGLAGSSARTHRPPSPLAPQEPVEIPEPYRPSEWLCAVQPRKAPYHPQMGDECLYFRLGHERYLDAVSEKDIYKVGPRDRPWDRTPIKVCEYVKVVGIKYLIRPPRLVCLKLSCLGDGAPRSFTVKYHDMPDVIDFLVLRQAYETAVARNWGPGDRFRCMIDDGWWWGSVVERDATHEAETQFLGLRVRWDNGEYERLSPWDLEPLDPERMPEKVGGYVSVLPCELEAVLYRPRPDEWPGGDREEACAHIAQALDQVMGLSIAEPFVAPVDLNVYPSYAYVVEYPIDLSTIKARFQNHFYRRVASAQFDVRYLATNAEQFNRRHTRIVRQARLVTDLLLLIIKDVPNVDVAAAYHRLVENYNSSDSEGSKNQVSGSTNAGWQDGCARVLREICDAPDSEPFRLPVDLDQVPDYNRVVSRPMDLSVVTERLEGGQYCSGEDFARDMRLIFHNSKQYNTNKRSRIYSMTLRLSTLFETLYKTASRPKRHRRRVAPQAGHYDTSDDETLAATSTRARHNGHTNRHRDRAAGTDSTDSDLPLRGASTSQGRENGSDPPFMGKGKGKGKKSKPPPVEEAPNPRPRPARRKNIESDAGTISVGSMNGSMYGSTRSKKSLRSNGSAGSNGSDQCMDIEVLEEELEEEDVEVTYEDEYIQEANSKHSSDWSGSGSESAGSRMGGSRVSRRGADRSLDDGDTTEGYTPPRWQRNGHAHRKTRKRGSKPVRHKRKRGGRPRASHTHNSRPSKRRKVEGGVSGSSDEQGGDWSGSGGHRYESDRSYRPRAASSDDDAPLGTFRSRGPHSRQQQPDDNQAGPSHRPTRRSNQAADGPSGGGSSGSRRRAGRARSRQPRYNEDSEEDSIAAISKRLRRDRPPTHTQGRMQVGRVRDVTAHTQPQPDHNYYNGSHTHNTLDPPHTTHAPSTPAVAASNSEDELPISVSSRGRVRKLTAKARGLLRD